MGARSILIVGAMTLASLVGAASAHDLSDWAPPERSANVTLAAGATCKTVSSCEEAVELWCSGYRRADGDGDGIPCENVCHSLDQVNKIREKIGC